MEEPPGHRAVPPGGSARIQPEQKESQTRPVPRAWLVEFARDGEHLDRLLADAELAERMESARYEGREWDYFATELIKYGLNVLVGWMRTGLIWKRLKSRGFGGLPSPPEWEWERETWQSLAADTVVIAVEKFRDTVLRPGKWDPRRGASLKTYFIGQCLIRFPNVYRSWEAETSARQAERPGDAEDWLANQDSLERPENRVLVRDEVLRELVGLDERTRHALLLLNRGYDQYEVAERMGITRKAVEMIVRRQAERGRKRHGRAS